MSNTTITAGYVSPAVVGLTDAATIAVDAALGNDFRVTIAGDRQMGSPANPVDGQRITFQISQGAGGGHILSWDSGYNFGAVGAPALSVEAGQTDVFGFIYNAAKAGWLCAGTAVGF
jgi:hypothetical protein